MSTLRRLFLLALLPLLLLAAVPAPALLPITGLEALAAPAGSKLPTLEKFTEQVRNGDASMITGIYIPKVLAYPVLQQPSGSPAYVSDQADRLTQFSMATSYGSLGFLAHNTLAGSAFPLVALDALITVVYGDGHMLTYQVTQVRRFQAAQPTSPYSSFVDLANGKTLSAAALFQQTYGVQGSLILQTCITRDGLDTWGRLFIIALPYTPESARQR